MFFAAAALSGDDAALESARISSLFSLFFSLPASAWVGDGWLRTGHELDEAPDIGFQIETRPGTSDQTTHTFDH